MVPFALLPSLCGPLPPPPPFSALLARRPCRVGPWSRRLVRVAASSLLRVYTFFFVVVVVVVKRRRGKGLREGGISMAGEVEATGAA